jgi:hypothetical protein
MRYEGHQRILVSSGRICEYSVLAEDGRRRLVVLHRGELMAEIILTEALKFFSTEDLIAMAADIFRVGTEKDDKQFLANIREVLTTRKPEETFFEMSNDRWEVLRDWYRGEK